MSMDGITGWAVDTISPDMVGNMAGSSGLIGPMLSAMAGIMSVFVLIFLAIYVYFSLAYSKIGHKAGVGSPGVAWMPMWGVLAIIFESAKMKWWPFLAVVCTTSVGYMLMLFGLMNPGLLILASIVIFGGMLLFGIMTIIWHWKTYEAVGRPGWWILISAIGVIVGFLVMLVSPVIGMILYLLAILSHFVLIGIAAWGNGSVPVAAHMQRK